MFHVRATRDFQWLVQRTGSCLSERARGIECTDERTGRILAMVAYDQWTDNACTGHIAIDSPAAFRRLLRPTFEYPFEEARKGVLLIGVSSANTKSRKLVTHLGFEELCQVRDGISVGVHMIYYQMRREKCRWLETR